jgi:hypothetical protein
VSLPTPGPGRPQHPSYSDPSQGATLAELLFWILIGPVAWGLYELGRVVLGG